MPLDSVLEDLPELRSTLLGAQRLVDGNVHTEHERQNIIGSVFRLAWRMSNLRAQLVMKGLLETEEGKNYDGDLQKCIDYLQHICGDVQS